MATILEVNPAIHATNLIDSETGAACITEKAVDLTADCQHMDPNQTVLLFYTRTRHNGRIVRVLTPYPGQTYGMYIDFHVDRLDVEMRMAAENDTFGSTARRLGLSKEVLRALLKTHAPKA